MCRHVSTASQNALLQAYKNGVVGERIGCPERCLREGGRDGERERERASERERGREREREGGREREREREADRERQTGRECVCVWVVAQQRPAKSADALHAGCHLATDLVCLLPLTVPSTIAAYSASNPARLLTLFQLYWPFPYQYLETKER